MEPTLGKKKAGANVEEKNASARDLRLMIAGNGSCKGLEACVKLGNANLQR